MLLSVEMGSQLLCVLSPRAPVPNIGSTSTILWLDPRWGCGGKYLAESQRPLPTTHASTRRRRRPPRHDDRARHDEDEITRGTYWMLDEPQPRRLDHAR